MVRWTLYAAAWWLGLFPLYLLVTGSLSGGEILAGILVSGLAALVVTRTRSVGGLHFQPHLRWLRHGRRLPTRVLIDTWIVGAALARTLLGRGQSEGAFRTIPFDPGGEDAESAARRALVIAGACLAPNTYVVAVDADNKRLLIHQLTPTAEPPGRGDKEWPL